MTPAITQAIDAYADAVYRSAFNPKSPAVMQRIALDKAIADAMGTSKPDTWAGLNLKGDPVVIREILALPLLSDKAVVRMSKKRLDAELDRELVGMKAGA